jgi:hypothetical protein
MKDLRFWFMGYAPVFDSGPQHDRSGIPRVLNSTIVSQEFEHLNPAIGKVVEWGTKSQHPACRFLRRSPILREPFADPDYLFELKYDGLRALACVRAGAAQLISRKRNLFMSFGPLCRDLTTVLAKGGAVLLDGEIVVLDAEGRPQLYDAPPRRLSSRSTCSRVSSVSG